jgi:hypothetical protein
MLILLGLIVIDGIYSGVGHCIYNAPKWWYEFLKRAKAELSARPTTSVIFGVGFLAETVMATGCMRCPGNMLESMKYLESMKKQIDDLPCELEMDEKSNVEVEIISDQK